MSVDSAGRFCAYCDSNHHQLNHFWQTSQQFQSLYETTSTENTQLKNLLGFWHNHVCTPYQFQHASFNFNNPQLEAYECKNICDTSCQTESKSSSSAQTQTDLTQDSLSKHESVIEQYRVQVDQLNDRICKQNDQIVRQRQELHRNRQKDIKTEKANQLRHQADIIKAVSEALQKRNKQHQSHVEAMKSEWSLKTSGFEVQVNQVQMQVDTMKQKYDQSDLALKVCRDALQTQNQENLKLADERDRFAKACKTLSFQAVMKTDKFNEMLSETLGSLKMARNENKFLSQQLNDSEATLNDVLLTALSQKPDIKANQGETIYFTDIFEAIRYGSLQADPNAKLHQIEQIDE